MMGRGMNNTVLCEEINKVVETNIYKIDFNKEQKIHYVVLQKDNKWLAHNSNYAIDLTMIHQRQLTRGNVTLADCIEQEVIE